MRYHPLIHVTGIALFVLYFVSLFRNVFKLLLEDISPYAFSQDELAAIDPHPKDNGTEPIPRIIHQVYLGFDNRVMPMSWKNAQQSCIDLHPEYEYMVHCLTVASRPRCAKSITSFGRTCPRESSSPKSTRGSSRRGTTITSPSSVPIRSGTSFWRITVESTSTSIM
jgi:hypothetical protein